MLECFGFRGSRRERARDAEREPLLPQHRDHLASAHAEDDCNKDETTRQERLHTKLHTYLLLRALTRGYLPSTEQTVGHLRKLLSAVEALLNPSTSSGLSDSSLALLRNLRLWLQQFIKLLENKNHSDQIQDFIWYLVHARLHVKSADLKGVANTAVNATAKAGSDATSAYKSVRTVASLLLANSDFRLLLSDLETIGKEVLRDTASSLESAAHQASQKLEPSEQEQKALEETDTSKLPDPTPPTAEDLKTEVRDVAGVLADNAVEVAGTAGNSLTNNLVEDKQHQKVLASRMKQAVRRLCKRPDYAESVSILSTLLRNYLLAYSRAASETIEAVGDRVYANQETDIALTNFWGLLSALGDAEEWARVKDAFQATVQDAVAHSDLDELVDQVCAVIQSTLSDPEFFDDVEDPLRRFRERLERVSTRQSFSEHLTDFVTHLRLALRSVSNDDDIRNLFEITGRMASTLFPSGSKTNSELVDDTIQTLLPLVVQSIQYIPIPRLEVSSPAIDLLLENLILEPGRTVNNSSFLPFKLNISTYNDIEVRKARIRTASSMTTMVSLKISGMSIAADDLGFWMKVHSGLFRLMDQGLANFHLDERGLDITLDIEIGKDRIEKIVSLRNVNVKIHHLNYTLSKSKFACIAWLLKPLIRPIAKKALELKIAEAISQGLHALNRELVYARERLRAVRIADPNDLWTFIKATASRLTPPANPDLDTRVGLTPGGGVFRGRYAPGSLVKLWESEGRLAQQRLYEYEQGGWRNSIFDLPSV